MVSQVNNLRCGKVVVFGAEKEEFWAVVLVSSDAKQ
jgi:hypothetical protein